MIEAADRLAESEDITAAEQEIHAMTQCLSLLETAAVCLEAGNTDHAKRILDYVLVHKELAQAEGYGADRPWKSTARAAQTPAGNPGAPSTIGRTNRTAA